MLSDNELYPYATFICGHRRSGTTLLVSLLDNHPELMTIPADTAFFYAFYPPYENSQYTLEDKKKRILERCIYPFKEWTQSLKHSDYYKFITLKDMEQIFLNQFKETTGATNELLFAMAMTYRNISPLNKKYHKRWVEKTTSSEIYAADIKGWFPQAKFIHVIRDPRDNFASLKSGWEKRYKYFNDRMERLLQSHIERGKLGMELARWNMERFGKRDYLVVKYEDLTLNTEKVMHDISDFLNIAFNEILLKPTIWGVPWEGNNFEEPNFSGISQSNVNRWKERVTSHEACVIEFYYADIMEYFGYKTEFSKAEQIDAVRNQYAWHNFAQIYSVNLTDSITTSQKAD